ncbi:MAG: hypothetical protein ACPG5B_10935 [Chitinophagales bacterium]
MKLNTLFFMLFALFGQLAMAQQGEVMGKLESATATVVKVGNSFMLVPKDKPNMRYSASNMPEKFKQTDLKVVVSGNILKPPANVRLSGHPFFITDIKLAKATNNKSDIVGNAKGDIVGKLANEAATVMAKANQFVLVLEKNKSKHYLPDNLGKKYQNDGMRVVVSGDILKAPENARLIGTPFHISAIKIVKPTATNNKSDIVKGDNGIKYTSSVTDVKGSIMAKAGKFVIDVNGTHYDPSETLPANYRKAGTKVIFSGQVGTIPENIRMIGKPLKITNIKPDRQNKQTRTQPTRAKAQPATPAAKKAAAPWWKFW